MAIAVKRLGAFGAAEDALATWVNGLTAVGAAAGFSPNGLAAGAAPPKIDPVGCAAELLLNWNGLDAAGVLVAAPKRFGVVADGLNNPLKIILR